MNKHTDWRVPGADLQALHTYLQSPRHKLHWKPSSDLRTISYSALWGSMHGRKRGAPEGSLQITCLILCPRLQIMGKTLVKCHGPTFPLLSLFPESSSSSSTWEGLGRGHCLISPSSIVFLILIPVIYNPSFTFSATNIPFKIIPSL